MQFDGRGSKIMVVDHDRTTLEMVQIRLDVAGFHPLAARSSLAALPGRQTPPVLLVGRNIAAEDVRVGVQLGVRDVLAKPYSGASVLERLTRMLKKGAPMPASSPAMAAQALGDARGRVYLNC